MSTHNHTIPSYSLAAIYLELGLYDVDDIHISPLPQINARFAQEIAEVRTNELLGTVTIYTRRDNTCRKEFFLEAGKNNNNRDLLAVLDREIGRFQTLLEVEKRKHVLGGAAHIETGYKGLSDAQREILDYYLPCAPLARDIPEMIALCFQGALQCPVQIKQSEGWSRMFSGAQFPGLGDGGLDTDWYLTGSFNHEGPCFYIELGPLSPEALIEFLPGQPSRIFLEEHLIPPFFPGNSEYKIELIPEGLSEIWSLSAEKHRGILEIDTLLG